MYTSTELRTLSGKYTGGITVYPIVEIRLLGGQGGGLIQIVPVALVTESFGELSTFIIDNMKTSDEQSAG